MRFLIFISNEDDFYGSAKKIQDICKIECKIIYIEEFIRQQTWNKINDFDIIYFLCNGEKVNYALNKIISTNKKCEIINKEYLLKNENKSIVQQKLGDIGVNIPTIIKFDNIQDVKFPIFCKQNCHTGIVFKAYTKRTIIDFFQKFNLDDFYLEESVTSDLERHREFKMYYANGKIYSKDGENNLNVFIEKTCVKIARILYDLQAFSVDFIENSKGIYVIDVNIASGFYMSTGAREEFVKEYVNKEK